MIVAATEAFSPSIFVFLLHTSHTNAVVKMLASLNLTKNTNVALLATRLFGALLISIGLLAAESTSSAAKTFDIKTTDGAIVLPLPDGYCPIIETTDANSAFSQSLRRMARLQKNLIFTGAIIHCDEYLKLENENSTPTHFGYFGIFTNEPYGDSPTQMSSLATTLIMRAYPSESRLILPSGIPLRMDVVERDPNYVLIRGTQIRRKNDEGEPMSLAAMNVTHNGYLIYGYIYDTHKGPTAGVDDIDTLRHTAMVLALPAPERTVTPTFSRAEQRAISYGGAIGGAILSMLLMHAYWLWKQKRKAKAE